jgi:hypothetical protein
MIRSVIKSLKRFVRISLTGCNCQQDVTPYEHACIKTFPGKDEHQSEGMV